MKAGEDGTGREGHVAGACYSEGRKGGETRAYGTVGEGDETWSSEVGLEQVRIAMANRSCVWRTGEETRSIEPDCHCVTGGECHVCCPI